MNTALTHFRNADIAPAPRLRRDAPAALPARQRTASTLSLATAGALALLATAILAAGLGVPVAQWPALFLVGGAILWTALALDRGRPLPLAMAALNLVAMTAGAWALNAGLAAITPLYGVHLLLLGLALLDREAAASAPARIWSGAELAALALMVVSF